MRCVWCIISIVLYYFGIVAALLLDGEAQNLQAKRLNCHAFCTGQSGIRLENDCQCAEIIDATDAPLDFDKEVQQNTVEEKIVKRDTLQDLATKINKNRNAAKTFTFRPTQKPKKNANQKKWPAINRSKNKAAEQPQRLKELQDRLRELKLRMSARPQLKPRANFDENDTGNLIGQLKSKHEEFKEKIKLKLPAKIPSTQGNPALGNRLSLEPPRISNQNKKSEDELVREAVVVSSTTELSTKASNIPVIVLMSSTTAVPEVKVEPTEPKKAEKANSPLERIMEKQKEAVTKIKDKISLNKANQVQ